MALGRGGLKRQFGGDSSYRLARIELMLVDALAKKLLLFVFTSMRALTFCEVLSLGVGTQHLYHKSHSNMLKQNLCSTPQLQTLGSSFGLFKT